MLKMFSICLNQVEMAVLTTYIPTTKLLVQSTYQKVVKLTQFEFPNCTYKERMFSIQEQCT